ncbi:unnamed protein product [Phytophthora lilii]|uniref:Unnamed protein product n=1 Tax=Phytophthora lilii TaxID=2077276 RepID=A0A9W6X733_9STRA|nr:unnamed protein product [Phytophthora lilii]
MEILSRHIDENRWPLEVECAVESLVGDADRWSRLFSAANGQRHKQMTKMCIPSHLTECHLSAQHCLERSGTVKEVNAMFRQQGCAIPVTEVKLHLGWRSVEKNEEKRLRDFRRLMCRMTNKANSKHSVRVLQLTGRCLASASFIGSLCSALPYIESVEELHSMRSSLWRWIAVSLFHPQAKSKLKSLDLSHCNVLEQDIDIVEDALGREWSSVIRETLVASKRQLFQEVMSPLLLS